MQSFRCPQADAFMAFQPLSDPGTTKGRQARTKCLDAIVTVLARLEVSARATPGARVAPAAAAAWSTGRLYCMSAGALPPCIAACPATPLKLWRCL